METEEERRKRSEEFLEELVRLSEELGLYDEEFLKLQKKNIEEGLK